MPTTHIWLGGATSTAQVDSVTPASVGVGNTFTVTVNGKTASFVATAATVANVTAGLAAAIAASHEPEIQQLSAADNGGVNVLVTGPDDGTPFTLTASAAGGTATNTRAAVTAPVSPHDLNTPANLSSGVAVANGDTLIYDGTSTVDCLFGLNQSGVTGVTLVVNAGYTGNIGLPERNPAGYAEYRTTYLRIGATSVLVGGGSGAGTGGPSRLKLDTGSGGTTMEVLSTGSGGTEAAPMLWKGTGTNNINVVGGTDGLAALAGATATAASLLVGGNATVIGGSGLTLTGNLTQTGGTCTLGNGLAGTINKSAGTLVVVGGTAANVNNDGGDLVWASGGNITGTLNTSDGAFSDFTKDVRLITVAACVLNSGAKLWDPQRRVTWTAGPVTNRCGFKDVDVDFGTHLQFTIAAGP